jgi:hypothetical protein
MLLGPGKQHLQTRQTTQIELAEIGYKRVVIMEQIKDSLTDRILADKFNRIITDNAPRLYIAFFHNDAKMDGVTFELGWLCHMYHLSGLNNNLRFLLEPGWDWKQTTPYIPSLLPGVPAIEFDENNEYSKASELIHLCARNLF